MNSSEALRSPQKPLKNDRPRAVSPVTARPNGGVAANSTRSTEPLNEAEAGIADQDYGTNVPMLLPGVIPSQTLPAGKVFPIQIGSELFKLSGASISSDGKNNVTLMFGLGSNTNRIRAPSYFSQFFSEQLMIGDNQGKSVRTLYIDRDPVTFRDILLHLQGMCSALCEAECKLLRFFFIQILIANRYVKVTTSRSAMRLTLSGCLQMLNSTVVGVLPSR